MDEIGVELVAAGVSDYIADLNRADAAVGDFVKSADTAAAGAGGLGDTLKGAFSGVGTVVAGAAGVAVAGVATIGTAAISAAADVDQAQRDMQTKLGLTAEEAERMGMIAQDVFVNNFGGSVTEAASAVAQVRQSLKTLSEDELSGATQKALALEDAFGADMQGTLGAVDSLMRNFGLTSDEAFNFVTAGYQKGLDSSGDFLDTIGEYGVQFGEAGFDAGEFFSTLETGIQGGVLGTDKIADATKEFRIRITEMGADARETYVGIGAAIGENLGVDAFSQPRETLQALQDEAAKLGIAVGPDLAEHVLEGGETFDNAFATLITQSFQEGKLSAADMQQVAIDGLKKMDNQVEQNAIGVQLFGTQWEDLGPTAVLSIDTTKTSLEDLGSATDDLSAQYDTIPAQFESMKREASLALAPIGQEFLKIGKDVMPIVVDVIKEVSKEIVPIIKEYLPPLVEWLKSWLPDAARGAGVALKGIVEILKDASAGFKVVQDAIGAFGKAFDTLRGGLTVDLSQIGQNIRNTFTELGWKIPQTVTQMVWNIADSLRQMVQSAGNAARDWVAGIVQGIQGAWYQVISTVTSNINNFIATVKRYLGIASPSWIAEDLMGNFVGTMAVTAEDLTPDMAAAGAGAAQAFVDTVGSGMAVPVGGALTGAALAAGGNTSNRTTNVNQTIYNQGGGDASIPSLRLIRASL